MTGLLQIALLAHLMKVGRTTLVLEPRNVTTLRGTPARFTCSVSERWDVMVWQLDTTPLLTISMEHGPLGCSDSVCAVNRSTGSASAWELVLNTPTFTRTVQEVVCTLLPSKDQRQTTAALLVQEKGTVTILGGNMSVQEGALLTLECQAQGWYPTPTLSWTINGTSVDSSRFNTSSVEDATGLFNLTSVLRVKVEGTSWVECLVCVSALNTPQRSSVSVCVEPPGDDRALVIAVAVIACIIAVVALLALLFYCVRLGVVSKLCHDGTSLEDQDSGKTSERETTEGKVNQGYQHETPSESSHPAWRVNSSRAPGGVPEIPEISHTAPKDLRVDRADHSVDRADLRADSGSEYFTIQRGGVPKTVRMTTTV
ncbi:immunoglobulin superfamily member 5 [Brachyhypopomus gauderio]|uniref:immunoglobulin superfamily member 5 n=1 Tax=Brachyhypopomus gauderio TaxID=698409 RepID=UPI0040419062